MQYALGLGAELMFQLKMSWQLFLKSIRRSGLVMLAERRITPRIILESPTPCTVMELHSKTVCNGSIADISENGFRIHLDQTLPLGRAWLVTFFDQITGQNISGYLLPLQSIFRRRSSDRKTDNNNTVEYRCRLHPDLHPSAHYSNYYQRILSDTYVNKLRREVKNFPKLPRRDETIKFKIAETAKEKEAAYRLVYDEYIKRGFADPNPYGMFTYRYQLLPDTTTIVGILKGEVVMTITIVKSSVFNLPMDEVFKDVLDPLRAEGKQLVEFSMLATKKQLFGKKAYSLRHFRKMAFLFSLFRFAVQYALHIVNATDVVIAIPPRYQDLYRYLSFSLLTTMRYYGKYNTPAVAMRLNLLRVGDPRYLRFCLSKFFFGKKILDPDIHEPAQLRSEDIDYLFDRQSDLMQRLSQEDLRKLYEHCPETYGAIIRTLWQQRMQNASVTRIKKTREEFLVRDQEREHYADDQPQNFASAS